MLIPTMLSNPTPLTFLGCSIAATLMIRYYAYLNRADIYQEWFIVAGLLCWLMLSVAADIDLLVGGVCVMPWTVLASLLLSDVIHGASRAWTRPRAAIVGLHCISDDGFVEIARPLMA